MLGRVWVQVLSPACLLRCTSSYCVSPNVLGLSGILASVTGRDIKGTEKVLNLSVHSVWRSVRLCINSVYKFQFSNCTSPPLLGTNIGYINK